MKTPTLLSTAVLASVMLSAAQTGGLHIPIQQFKLDNGLRVIVSEDHSAPTYAISVTYNAGSRDERRFSSSAIAVNRNHNCRQF